MGYSPYRTNPSIVQTKPRGLSFDQNLHRSFRPCGPNHRTACQSNEPHQVADCCSRSPSTLIPIREVNFSKLLNIVVTISGVIKPWIDVPTKINKASFTALERSS